MGRAFFFTIIFVFSSLGSANCGSRAFSDWGILNQNYPAGAEGMATTSNWVDPSIYTHADGIFGKVHQLVQTAESHVYIQTWTFHPKTKPALYLADAIRRLHARRTQQGRRNPVHIWLMLNIISLQNEAVEQQKMDRYIVEQGLDLDGIEIHVGFFKAKLLGANHVKTVSVDHKVALITGANFSPSNNGKGFFDLGFVVKGDVLKSLDYDFVQTWQSFVKTETQPRSWGHQLSGSSDSCHPILLTRSKAFPNFTTQIQKNSMTDALLASVRGARENIEIITPNLNVTKLLDEIAKAVIRGVKVRIILSKGFTDFAQDLPTRGGNNDMSIDRLHRGLYKYLRPAEICERLQIHWYGLDGVTAVETTKPPANHAKFMLVDNKIAMFGSANMDNQSWVNSREISLFVDKRSLASRWTKDFFNPVFDRSVVVQDCKHYAGQ